MSHTHTLDYSAHTHPKQYCSELPLSSFDALIHFVTGWQRLEGTLCYSNHPWPRGQYQGSKPLYQMYKIPLPIYLVLFLNSFLGNEGYDACSSNSSVFILK